jgi:hypothetical protein
LYSDLKAPITIALILLIAAQTFSKCFVILDFKINENYIAKTLCINRDNPMSCCHGKCFLCKRLAKDETQQQAPVKGNQKEQTPPLFWLADRGRSDHPRPVSIASQYGRYIVGKSQEFSRSFFQPPQA